MRLEALPAGKGDCLILQHEEDDAPRLIVVDGGPGGVYAGALRPRLLAIRDERVATGQLGDEDPLPIDLLIVSHIDDDHINGVKALLQDMSDARDGKRPDRFQIGRIWHNGFDSLLGAEDGVVDASVSRAVTASLGSAVAAVDDTEPGHELSKVIASIGQGHDVVRLAKKLDIPINPEFGGRTIVASDGEAVDVHGLRVTVVGPLRPELDRLRADFAKWLVRRSGGGTPSSLIASFDDRSVANLSSIVLLVDDARERYLLTGDARGDRILAGIEELGLADAEGRLVVDVLKVQHHGSDRNSTVGFFERVVADRCIFSGNGEHGNPERDTLAFLAQARAGMPVVVDLTYPPGTIDAGRAKHWTGKHPDGPAFDHAAQGIVPFLAEHPVLKTRHPA